MHPMVFPLPEPGSEQAKAIEQYQKTARDAQLEQRRAQLYWAAWFCTCPAWWSGPGYPPQAECIVHGQMLIGPEGQLL